MNRRKRYRYPGIRPGKMPDSYIIDYCDHNGKRHQVTFYGNEKDAVKLRRQLLAKRDRIMAGIEASPDQMVKVPTLVELWDQFRNDRQMKVDSGSMVHKSLERYRNSINALFDFRLDLKYKRIDEIEPIEIEEFKIFRMKKGYSSVGINTNLRNLRSIFKFAIDKGLIKHSPLKGVSSISVRESDVRFLNEEELKSLNMALEQLDLNDQYQKDAHDLVLVYLYTGARASEILYPVFTWDCIGENSINFPRTKSFKSRVIPLTNTVKQALDSRKHINGGPFHFNVDLVYNRVKYVMRKAGIKKASTHTLRKSTGAWYYMATRDIFATSKFLGHSSVKVTEKHYAGLIQSLQIEYSSKFEQTLKIAGCY